MMDAARLANLRRQAQAFARTDYDGHNRRSTVVTMVTLGHRRARRRWRMWLAAIVRAA